jgi:hypothetical protein
VHVFAALKIVTFGTVVGNGVGGAAVEVSKAGSSDHLMYVPPIVQLTSVPTSGERKKFCCANTCCACVDSPASAPAARYPACGAAACTIFMFVWTRIGCENASGLEIVATPA